MTHVLPEIHPWVWSWLTDYQRAGTAFAVQHGNAHLWWGCGGGKTAAGIIWSLAVSKPVIVFARSAARLQWAREVRRLTTVEPHIVLPKANQRAGYESSRAYIDRIRAREGRVFLILGWPALRDDDVYRMLQEIDWPSIIWDESHTAKDHKRWMVADENPDTGEREYVELLSVAARAGFLAPYAGRRLGLTATPVPDRPRDLWAQLDIVQPKAWGRYWDFARSYCDAREGQYGMLDDGASNVDELRQRTEAVAHVVRSSEVAEHLPPLRRMLTTLDRNELNRSTADAGREVRTAARKVKGGTGAEGADTEDLLVARLAQAATRKDRYIVQTTADCIASGQKVLIFTGLRSHVANLAKLIRPIADKAGVPCWDACGDTDPEEREHIRDAYMDHDGGAVIIGTGDAWGESLNLQDTDRLIIAMLPWTWRQIRQWEGRVHRLGMTKAAIVEYLIAQGTADDHVAAVVLEKLDPVEALLPDEQITGIREGLVGGTDDEVLAGLVDRMMGAA